MVNVEGTLVTALASFRRLSLSSWVSSVWFMSLSSCMRSFAAGFSFVIFMASMRRASASASSFCFNSRFCAEQGHLISLLCFSRSGEHLIIHQEAFCESGHCFLPSSGQRRLLLSMYFVVSPHISVCQASFASHICPRLSALPLPPHKHTTACETELCQYQKGMPGLLHEKQDCFRN